MTCCGAGGGGGGVWGGKVEKRGRGKVVVVEEGWRERVGRWEESERAALSLSLS